MGVLFQPIHHQLLLINRSYAHGASTQLALLPRPVESIRGFDLYSPNYMCCLALQTRVHKRRFAVHRIFRVARAVARLTRTACDERVPAQGPRRVFQARRRK